MGAGGDRLRSLVAMRTVDAGGSDTAARPHDAE
jgi:hypothetical protein